MEICKWAHNGDDRHNQAVASTHTACDAVPQLSLFCASVFFPPPSHARFVHHSKSSILFTLSTNSLISRLYCTMEHSSTIGDRGHGVDTVVQPVVDGSDVPQSSGDPISLSGLSLDSAQYGSDISRPSSAGDADDSYSDFDTTDSDDYDDEDEDLTEEVIQARLHDDEYRDIAHFFKDHPTMARTQAALRASGVHKIAQLKRLTVKQLLRFGVPLADADVICEALGLVRGSATPEPVALPIPSTGASGAATTAMDPLPTPSPTLPLANFTDRCPAFVQYKESSPAPSPSCSHGSWDRMSCGFSASPCIDDVDTDELTCPVCLGIMVDPVTLICGHSTCKRCCNLAFELSSKCPAGCGRVMPRCLPEVNVSLRSAVQRRYGMMYLERAREVGQFTILLCI